MSALQGKRVLMVIAPKDFRDEEYLVPRQALEEAGAVVTVASTARGEARGMLGARVTPDLPLAQASASDYDAVIFVGGSGAKVYFKDRQAHDLARQATEQQKVLGAICIAPSILANAGLLQGKTAAVFPSERGNLQKHGATVTGNPVEQDGLLITGSGPEAAADFAARLLAALSA